MKLKSITIEKYKSIQNSITINLDDTNRFYAFIGKNGSGKTNVLQAIRYAFAKENYYSRSNRGELLAKYRCAIESEEKARFFSTVDIKGDNDEVEITFVQNNPDVKMLSAPFIQSSIQQYKSVIESIHKKIKKESHIYINQLKEIEQKYYKDFYLNLTIKRIETGQLVTIRNDEIQALDKVFDTTIEKIERYLCERFGENVPFESRDYLYQLDIYDYKFFKIKVDNELEFSPIIAKSLGLNELQLKEANERLNKELDKINKQLESSYSAIQSCIQEFNSIVKEIEKIFTLDQDKYDIEDEKQKKDFDRFCELLKRAAFKTCYYIDNEESLLFYDRERGNDYYRQEMNRSNYNSQNPIIAAIDNYLNGSGLYKDGESILERGKISHDRLSELVDPINKGFLSDIILDFDKDEIKGFHIETSENGLVFYVDEKNDGKINFNETSLGRRWYLTYNFVKQLLKPGDILFIDEPAAFLHPQAQAEIKQDLQKLSKQGIYVFITTHSPYMIPENWHNVYNVSMTEKGTIIERFNDDDEICKIIKNELGVLTTNSILFNLSKTLLLVEGSVDKECVVKFARKLNYNLNDYIILPCNGHPIIGMIYLCIVNGIKFKALLDLDNKDKPKIWLEQQYGYKEYLEMIKNNKNCVFTPPIRNKKSIEDCFNEKDAGRYFSQIFINKDGKEKTKLKVDKDKVLNGEIFEQETLDNFEQLFIQLGIPKLTNNKYLL